MRDNLSMIRLLIMIGLLILIPAGGRADGWVESPFGEEGAEERFSGGMGGTWVWGERYPRWCPFNFSASYSKTAHSGFMSAFKEEVEYDCLDLEDLAILGYVAIVSGNLTVADPLQTGFTIPQEAGIYPIYGAVDPEGEIEALYVDLTPEDPAV